MNPHGRICALKKSGGGGIEPSLLNAMLQAARPHGLEMLKKMRGAMEREETRVEGLGDQDLVLH